MQMESLSKTNEIHIQGKKSIKELRQIIRDMGIKITKQRLAILTVLNNDQSHVTAQEVYEELSKSHPEIGFATVYRFLRKLTELKLVTEVRMGGLPARYELAHADHHDHLTCTVCGLVVEFEEQQIEELQEKVANQNGFRLTGHVLELYGECPSCLKVKSPDILPTSILSSPMPANTI